MDIASLRRCEYSENLTNLKSSFENEGTEDDIIKDNTRVIIKYLHDSWSEIRKDSAKFLKKVSISKKLLKNLYLELLTYTNKTYSWQIIHGTILGD